MKADEIAARRDQVAQLLLAHHSVRAIASDLDVPKSTIHRDISALRVEWQEARMEAMDQAAAEELQRLIVAERAIWPAVQRGDYQALAAFLKISERRAKLLGIDAPERIEVFKREEAQRVADELGLNVEDVMADAERTLARNR